MTDAARLLKAKSAVVFKIAFKLYIDGDSETNWIEHGLNSRVTSCALLPVGIDSGLMLLIVSSDPCIVPPIIAPYICQFTFPPTVALSGY